MHFITHKLNLILRRKFNQLASEIKRVNSNLTLSNEEKHNIASAKQQVCPLEIDHFIFHL